MFIRIIPINLHELLQNSRFASRTLDRKPRTIVEMAKNIPIMFVVAILWPKDSRADRAGKMFHMKLSTQCRNVAAP